MVSDVEIYQTAKLVVDQYGDSALIEASLRQDKMLECGDLDGARIWERISDAIEFFQIPKTLLIQVVH